MRLPEQRLNDWIAKWLAGRALVERVENRVKRDTPDIFVATPEWSGWIESKVLPAFPKRATTAVRLDVVVQVRNDHGGALLAALHAVC